MLLSSLVFLPLLFCFVLALVPQARLVRVFSLIFSLAHFGLSLTLIRNFDINSSALQFVEKTPWVEQWGISYFLGVDGLSIWLIMLTTFLTPLVILGSWTAISERVKEFHMCMFALQTAMLGTFVAMDAILFYVFFEIGLVPMYMMIGVWGGKRRLYATMKFFLFTMAGSVFMLLGIIYMMLLSSEQLGMISSSILDFYQLSIPFVAGDLLSPQSLLFFAFAIGLAIKVPMIPFHTWLPDAHVEAPTPGSVVLAGVLLKMGTYGFLRFSLPLFPEAAASWAWLFMFLAVLGIVYGALVAMVQPDMKKLVAYSSVSHMGYVVAGIFAMNIAGVSGGIFQMLSHGISTGALFFLVGMIYERTHSREISKYGGLATAMPIFTIFFFIITLSSIAVPMTNGFVGEFLILLGIFQASPGFAYVAVTGVILGAAYMLWMCKRVFFGKPGELVAASVESDVPSTSGFNEKLTDLSVREIAVLVPLVVMVFWMGLFPGHFLRYSEVSIENLVKNRSNYQLTIYQQSKEPANNTRKIAEVAQ